jgi:predicted Zn-dependent protease
LAYFNLGNVHYESGDFAQAIPAYEKAVELDPSLAVAHFFLARAYLKSKHLQQAAGAIKAGLQYDPQNNEAQQMLSQLEAYLKETE